MLGEEFAHLGLDRLGQQGARSVAQHLGERVGERPWLKQLDDVSIGHGVSLLCWRSGGLNTPTIRRLHPVSPSPTFAHSSSTVRDRVCMTAAMLVLEPIFEADLPPEIYAYRAGRNAQHAAVEVEELLFRGHPEVVDADLADYFGSIPHSDLLKSVARRLVDRRVLHPIKMWLNCPVAQTP